MKKTDTKKTTKTAAAGQNTARYQGWTNRETWCAALWINNDQQTQNHWLEIAKRISSARHTDGQWILAETLKEALTNQPKELENTMMGDMLQHALAQVDYEEIARDLIATVAEIETHTKKGPSK